MDIYEALAKAQRGSHTRRGGYHPPPWPVSTRDASKQARKASASTALGAAYGAPQRKRLKPRTDWLRVCFWTFYGILYAAVVFYFVTN